MSHQPDQKQLRSANAVGGKTARACDSCLRRRARWYCAADDAFLCQTCDTSVHSANPLARRHDRVRLKTSSSSTAVAAATHALVNSCLPAWHKGFKRKARTPRHAKPLQAASKRPVPLVPDLEASTYDDNNNREMEQEEEEEEEQLLYRVPIFDPVLSEFCSPPPIDDTDLQPLCGAGQVKPEVLPQTPDYHRCCDDGNFIGFTPSDMDLAEFAADVENLLGQGLDDDNSFCIVDGLGLREDNDDDNNAERVKMEFDGTDIMMSNNAIYQVDMEMELSRESLDMNFDCESPTVGEVEEVRKGDQVEAAGGRDGFTKKVNLRLDYEAVMSAWSCKGCSPWTNGQRPQSNLNDCWPDFMGTWGGGEVHGMYGDVGIGTQIAARDGGREARVSRYREKRRTRLFSKKIRYEVRKLNAEKRPRMKGRFVKRASIYPPAAAAPSFPY